MFPKVFIVLSTWYFQIIDTKKISEKAGITIPFYKPQGAGEVRYILIAVRAWVRGVTLQWAGLSMVTKLPPNRQDRG